MKRALLPSQRKTLTALGENIKLARLRRELSSEQVAERAGISRNTLTKIERGEEGVAMGYYFRVLAILGLEKDLLLVAKDDELGRALQDAKLVVGEREKSDEYDNAVRYIRIYGLARGCGAGLYGCASQRNDPGQRGLFL